MQREVRQRTAGLSGFGVTLTAACALGFSLFVSTARAERVENQTAVFAALDKVTASISPLNAALNSTQTFGALKVTARACYTRDPTEPPKTSAFVEVDEVLLDGSTRRIFSGWMFAESPGLNALEHPVFDIWLTDCADPARTAAAPGAGQAPQGESDFSVRRRVRR